MGEEGENGTEEETGEEEVAGEGEKVEEEVEARDNDGCTWR